MTDLVTTVTVTGSSTQVEVVEIAEQGPPGAGVPAGGTAGQILRKKSSAAHDTEWGADPSAAYTADHVTADRSFDADATSLGEVADVLGTLIADLQALGLIG